MTDEAFNIGNCEETSLKELLEGAFAVNHSKLTPEYREENSINPVSRRLADISKAKELLHFIPTISLEQGMKELSEWYFEKIKIDIKLMVDQKIHITQHDLPVFSLLDKTNVNIFFIVLFLIQIVFIFQGIDIADEGFHSTFYQQIYHNPQSVEYNFMYWFSGITGGAWLRLFPELWIAWFATGRRNAEYACCNRFLQAIQGTDPHRIISNWVYYYWC